MAISRPQRVLLVLTIALITILALALSRDCGALPPPTSGTLVTVSAEGTSGLGFDSPSILMGLQYGEQRIWGSLDLSISRKNRRESTQGDGIIGISWGYLSSGVGVTHLGFSGLSHANRTEIWPVVIVTTGDIQRSGKGYLSWTGPRLGPYNTKEIAIGWQQGVIGERFILNVEIGYANWSRPIFASIGASHRGLVISTGCGWRLR